MSKSLFKTIIINYLKTLSHIKLKWKFKGKIIALGGCFGKTSAISMLESILATEHKIYSTSKKGKGLNSETGVAFAILDIAPDKYGFFDWLKYSAKAIPGLFKKFEQEIFLVELGVDKPDDLKFLTSFIVPSIGILINSNNTHAAAFEELHLSSNKSYEELIAYENGYIFEAAKEAIIYNLDDPEVVQQIGRFCGDVRIPFSISNNSSVKVFKPSLAGTEIRFEYLGGEYSVNYWEPLLDEYRNSIEMALKVAEYYKLKPENIVKGIENFELPPSRCSLFAGVNGSFIIDSSYNSAYLPASSALKLVNQIHKKRRIAILGDMRELGDLTEKEHRKLAHSAIENIDVVVTIGPNMKRFFNDEFVDAKKADQVIFSFDTTKEALEFLSKDNFGFVKADDVILVKGSQNTLLLETIVENLLKDKSNVKRLCRRGEFYQGEREKLLK